ncbi:guanine nucleotide-binding protein alpha-3 subunit [Atractiella rhizophila]|nr:guanine nucleotide-binding protein alpha-3 subunit [Atractiella rhizophila]
MGGCLSTEDSIPPHPLGENGLRQRNVAIDKQIDEDARKFRKECKILLLGSGESGKSTVVKQMKIIHQGGYSRDELLLARMTIYKNIIESAQAIVLALRKFNLEPKTTENRANAERIFSYRLESVTLTLLPSGGSSPLSSPLQPSPYSSPSAPVEPEYSPGEMHSNLTDGIVKAIQELWADEVIGEVLEKANQFYLMDSAPYFFDNIQRIGAYGYVPTMDDYLYARTKTTGITETHFKSGPLSIHMFDVGGQRSERKKWIHCFEAVTSIIFCVALSEYDQVLLEENSQNRMDESLLLFESVINSRWFIRTSIILFLNKIDLFRAKLPRVPLNQYFPEYSGGNDVGKAAKYILWRFNQLNRAKLSVYPHLTQATDTSNIRLVFAAVKETILQNALRDSGIL